VHRLVGEAFLGLPEHLEIDHRNHQRSDSSQIRIATRAENARNASGWANHSSRYKGVSWNKQRRQWYACISVDGRAKSLGKHKTEREAALAYDRAARKAWGAFAFLNLPEVSE
jgi:hypothetical protein